MDDTDALRVLLIEDNPGDARLLKEYLRESEQAMDIRWERELESGLKALASDTQDVVVIDLGLPDSSGPDTVERCAEAAGSVPVVVLTGRQKLEVALSALEAGAVEYLQKGELTPSLASRTLRWAVERARMRKELRLLSKAVDQSTESILITGAIPVEDPGPRIVYVNEAFEAMTGYREADVLGKSLRILEGPETDPNRVDALYQSMARGETWQGETIHYRKDGTPYIVQWNVAPVKGADDEIEYWVSVQRDVTAVRQMWERLLDVQEEERRRIDQEIHDEMGGLLASIQMKVQAARLEAQEHELSTDALDDVSDLLNDLSVAARTIARQLHPRVLDTYGLSEAISNLTRKIEEQHDITVKMRNSLDSDDHLSSLVERTAYRVIQEAVLNVVRHAQVDTTQVFLKEMNQQLRIRVRDDGVGFDPAEREREDNYGLKGMIDRVERLDGTVEIETAPHEGTEIVVMIPVAPSSFPVQFSSPNANGSSRDQDARTL